MQCTENQVSSQAGLNTHLSRLGISHFTDEDDVGSLAEHGSNDASKVQSDVVPDFDLVDTWQVVFDGVFGGDDLAVGSVQGV